MVIIPQTETSSEVRIDRSAGNNWLYIYQGNVGVEPLILDRQQALPLLREIIDFVLEAEGFAFNPEASRY